MNVLPSNSIIQSGLQMPLSVVLIPGFTSAVLPGELLTKSPCLGLTPRDSDLIDLGEREPWGFNSF